MKLSSARDLKAELLARPRGTGPGLRALASEISAASAMQPGTARSEGFALGIHGRKGDFRLAVRLQVSSPALGLLIESFRERAKGEIDVRHVGRVRKQAWHRQRNRPLLVGGSIGPAGRSYGGTLGCFVVPRGRSIEDAAQILSNNHVLADENALAKGAPIVQQARLDGGRRKADRVATLTRFVRLKKRNNLVDAAVADLDGGISVYTNWLTGLGELAGVRSEPLETGETVYKVGRTTGLTEGRVSAIEVDRVLVDYDMGTLRFDQQVEVEPARTEPFSLGGDSGSLVVDAQRRAVALLFAGNDVDATYASPIEAVLDALRVDLVT